VLTRRAALTATASGLGLGAAACAGFRVGSVRTVPDDVVLFTTWAGDVHVPLERVRLAADRPARPGPVHPARGAGVLQGQYATDYPTLMSGALLSSLPVLLLFVVAQRSFVTGLTRTGMK
jgi:hypothetical protein